MEFITGEKRESSFEILDLPEMAEREEEVTLTGMAHSVRELGSVRFLILRRRDGLVQCVYEEGASGFDWPGVREETALRVRGLPVFSHQAPGGIEIRLRELTILSEPTEPMPIPVAKKKWSTSLETELNLRPISLRNLRERAIFRVQEGLVRGFRDYLNGQGFTEIHTPKIQAKGAEGGSNIFKFNYFGKKAELAQSPQFYKQTMVGVYDRVFEVGPVFRAEKHNTKRHLNEYTSMDLEMGFIESFYDIMEIETGILQYTMKLLASDYQQALNLLGAKLPDTRRIPYVRFDEAKRLVSEKYHRPIRNPYDLEPEEEALIGQYFEEEANSDFVFVTHYPSKKRPFYAMDDPADPTFTLSFDLLFRGVEVTTGGQRIHDPAELNRKMEIRGMTGEGMGSYLMIFRHGMPPHGGLGIGLERLTSQLLHLDNVREAALFPRDLSRLTP